MFVCPHYLLCGDPIHPISMETIQTTDLKHNLHRNLWLFAQSEDSIFWGLLESSSKSWIAAEKIIAHIYI